MIKMTERKRPDVIDEVIRFMEHVPGATTSLYGGLNPNDIKVERINNLYREQGVTTIYDPDKDNLTFEKEWAYE